MTPSAIFVSGCTLAVLAVGVWVVRPGGPDPHDPRQAAAARQEYMLALAGVILLAVLATAASADTFLIEDVGECAEAIERAVRAVEVRGMETLIMRMPKGAAKMPVPLGGDGRRP